MGEAHFGLATLLVVIGIVSIGGELAQRNSSFISMVVHVLVIVVTILALRFVLIWNSR